MTAAKILIVEDDRVVARDISQQLERLGHTVVGVTALGEQALPLTLETGPDLVLMDIRLDGAVDGIDAAEQSARNVIDPSCFSPLIRMRRP
jgi:CheY-like chemotaxis protein